MKRRLESAIAAMRSRPGITAFMAVCTLAGGIAGWLWLSPEWWVGRRVAAGLVSGAGCGLIIATTRMIGKF